MNKTECENCKRVMEEGIRNANQAIGSMTTLRMKMEM